MVGTLERNEAARMAGRAKDLAGVGDADGVVGRRMHDEQRPPQGAYPLVKIRIADIVDEMALQRERLTADEERRLAVFLDSVTQRVVVVFDVCRVVRRTHTGHGGD